MFLKRSLFVCALLMSASTLPAISPARADDLSIRMDQLEQQLRQLTGQMEQLTFQLKQLQAQKKLGAVETAPATNSQLAAAPAPQAPALPAAPAQPKLAAAAPQAAPVAQPQTQAALTLPRKKPIADVSAQAGVETIEEVPVQQATNEATPLQVSGGAQVASAASVAAPAPRMLGATAKSAQGNDGGFQGQVLVPATGDGTDATAAVASNADGAAMAEPVSVQAPAVETPDDLFMRSEQALLQLQYPVAEEGFRDFVAKYPNHPLTGTAEFKLGETFWAQQDYAGAAQAYMTSYKQWPKGRRAPDSLLKLALAMSRLDKKDQACSLLGSVDSEYPNAVEVKKRAQAEFRRNGC